MIKSWLIRWNVHKNHSSISWDDLVWRTWLQFNANKINFDSQFIACLRLWQEFQNIQKAFSQKKSNWTSTNNTLFEIKLLIPFGLKDTKKNCILHAWEFTRGTFHHVFSIFTFHQQIFHIYMHHDYKQFSSVQANTQEHSEMCIFHEILINVTYAEKSEKDYFLTKSDLWCETFFHEKFIHVYFYTR